MSSIILTDSGHIVMLLGGGGEMQLLVQLEELDPCGRDNAGLEREVSSRSRKVVFVF